MGLRSGLATDGDRTSPVGLVVSMKPKVYSRQSRINSYVEVTVDGLSSETKRTGKRTGSSELLWNETLTL